MMFFIVGVSVLVLVFIWMYNRLVNLRFRVRESWSDIDVQLKRRFDLLPQLAESVKAYTTYEKGLFERITELRAQSENAQTMGEKAAAQNGISQIAKTLLAVAESYPDLKANRSFVDLQKNISDIEEQIQYARRYYNGTVRDYNTLVLSFPSNIVAGLFSFKTEEFFEIELATQKLPPEVKLS